MKDAIKPSEQIKEIFASTELDDLLAESPDYDKVDYQVWLLGRNKNGDVVDFEYCIDIFEDVEEAVKCWDFFCDTNINTIKNKDVNFNIPEDVFSVDLVVEEVGAWTNKSTGEVYEECFNLVRETNIEV